MGFQYVNVKFVFENEGDSASVNFFIVDCDEKKGFRFEFGTMEDAKTSLWEMIEEKE